MYVCSDSSKVSDGVCRILQRQCIFGGPDFNMATFQESPSNIVCDQIWTLGSWNQFWSCLFNVCPRSGNVVLSIICIIWTSCILISDMLYQRISWKKRELFFVFLLYCPLCFYSFFVIFWVLERHSFQLQSTFSFLFIEYKTLMQLICQV